MLIKNTRYNIVYPRINNLRRKAFDIEDQLKEYFHQITLVPVPDDAPEEIPRISTTSLNGHSQLNMSLSNTQFVTSYDGEFEDDWEKCLEYVNERMDMTFSVLDKYVDGGYLFSGLTTEIVFEDCGDPIELIKNKFLNLKSQSPPHDVEQKITFVLENAYYVNITFKNIRIYEGLNIQKPERLMNEKAHCLACILDINDRHAFNYKEGYKSNRENAQKIISLTHLILKDKIPKMITEGVFDV